jgi:hypothetical protein
MTAYHVTMKTRQPSSNTGTIFLFMSQQIRENGKIVNNLEKILDLSPLS